MRIESMHDLLVHELKDLYNAEKQLVKALPKMAKNAGAEELREAFEHHLGETEGQVRRLEEIFEMLGVTSRGVKCVAMEGLIEEGKKMLEEDMDENLLDAALIGAAQKVEHYEIAAYGTARTWATRLGLHDVAEKLQETLDEEGAADKKLTELAESGVNQEAAQTADESALVGAA